MIPGTFAFGKRREATLLEADACVIGSGAGGATAACALAQAGLSVIVIEEGRSWKPSDFRPTTPWSFQHLYAGRGARNARGNTILPVPGGRGVGGSTLINSGICFRTPEPVLDDWRQNHGVVLPAKPEMDSLFDRVWTTIGASVSPPAVMGEHNDVFRRGCEALGLDGHWMTRSAPGCVGCGTCQQGCGSGGKSSVDKTFLVEALATGRVAVHADARVERIVTDGDRVVAVEGVEIDPDGYRAAGPFRVKARVFVLSAGAVGSPRLLRASGLGEGPVGEHLHVHPTSCVMGRFAHEIRLWEGATQGYYVDNWKEGYLLQTFNVPVDQFYLTVPLPPDEALAATADMAHYAMAGVVVHDEDSVGSVGTSGLTYHVGDIDRKRMLAGLRAAARAYFAAGAEHVLSAVHGAPVLRSAADVDRVLHDDWTAWDIGMYASHPMGTCRMGSDPARTVCTPEGRARGTANLYVADASVFPTSLGVNPQVTIMALGLTIGGAAARG